MVSIPVAATPVSSFRYHRIENGTMLIDKFIGRETDVTIPSAINGKAVTAIGKSAFCDIDSLISVSIPEGVTTIDDSAFRHCSSLTIVSIPESVTSINYSAFSNCEKLTGITIPNSVTYIGNKAFYDCASLTSVTIPANVTSIGGYAFYSCDNLTSITIPATVTSIGAHAFTDCPNLILTIAPGSQAESHAKYYKIPYEYASTTEQADDTSLPSSYDDFSISQHEDGRKTTIGAYQVLQTENGYRILKYTGDDTRLLIPSSLNGIPVVAIGVHAFSNCNNLISVTIPNGITYIGDYAFAYCANLASISIPDSVVSIGEFAFTSCTSLISLSIPNSVTYIGICAFQLCFDLTLTVAPSSYALNYAKEHYISYKIK